MQLRRNVLIFHSGALGDFLLTWPLALALGRLFPQSRVFYGTHAQKGALAEKVLRIDSFDVEVGWHHLFSQAPALPDHAVRLLAGAHCIFTFVAGPDGTWSRNVRQFAPDVPVVSLSQSIPSDFVGHQTDYLVQQLTVWPVWEQAVRQIVRSIEQRGVGANRADASASADGVIVLHPGSGSPHKCWPAGHFLELASKLANAGRRVRIIIGEVELERWKASEIGAFEHVGEVRRPGDLLGLLDCLTDAAGFVGNDSGPGHLAAMLGLRTVSLFGPTDPARWRPIGPRVTVLRANPLDSLSVEQVDAAVRQSR